jgi:hypothetical protein
MSGGDAPIQGVFAAIPTPFDERRGVDVKTLEYLADYLFERGIAGLALFTEASEDALLAPEERRLIIKTVSARLKGRKKFLLFVSALSSLEAIELVKLAEPKGCAGVVLAPPRAPGIGYRELYRHVDRVSKATQLPVVFMDRPDNVLEALMPEELEAFVGHPPQGRLPSAGRSDPGAAAKGRGPILTAAPSAHAAQGRRDRRGLRLGGRGLRGRRSLGQGGGPRREGQGGEARGSAPPRPRCARATGDR